MLNKTFLSLLTFSLIPLASQATLKDQFKSPPQEAAPETWFHLISGNVSKPALTKDLEAISGAGIQGIQLFHGRGRPWPGVSPQITTLSENWDDMIEHVADETQRLDLQFTMQNCPGWAMSGGPWITPDKAMRHLIWSRQDINGGAPISISLAQPQPSKEDWRDYRDITVLAFPTPADDNGKHLKPIQIQSNRPDLAWQDLLDEKPKTNLNINAAGPYAWLELTFAQATHLRSIELQPIELLMKRRNFDPDAKVLLEAFVDGHWIAVGTRTIPRGTWQDRQPEYPLVLAFPDTVSQKFRLTFQSKHEMALTYLRLSSAARVHDWRGQAGYALRSLERGNIPSQDPATWVKAEHILDLTNKVDASGKLTWNAPEGNWTVLRFGHVNTGVKNKPAPPEATGFECDKLSPAGAEQHFAGYIGRLTENGGPADKGRLQGMLIDSWECYTQTWTPAMEGEFAERRGYALRNWLPALAGYVINDHDTSERFLRDWRKTISDMLVHNYFGRLGELARERGMQLYFETAIGDVSPGDILQYFGKADIPMCEFWQPNDPHWGGFEAKPIHPTASAAHIYGKPKVAAEAFTNIDHRWNDHPFSFKHLADFHFALGVNHLVFHTYTHNPLDHVPGTSFGNRIGSPFVRGQTWWLHMPLFTDYIARCQTMLQEGHPVADVLWYLGDDLNHKPPQSRPFPNGYAFDYLNHDVLINRIEVVDGALQTPEGVRWKVLWLPEEDCARLTLATLRRLQQLIQTGATVIGSAPKQNPSLHNLAESDSEFHSLVDALWGTDPESHGDRQIGKGRLLWGADLASTLKKLNILPDVIGTQASAWCHRRSGDTDIYFIAGDRQVPLSANLRFRAKGIPELWDPLTGTATNIATYTTDETHTTVPINLPAGGSTFVVFRPGEATPKFTRIDKGDTTLIDAYDYSRVEQTPRGSTTGLTPGEPLQPWVDNPRPQFKLLDDGTHLLAFENGNYRLTRSNGTSTHIEVTGSKQLPINRDWTLSFPKGWDTPEMLKLPSIIPWSELKEPAAQAFSGTASYRSSIEFTAIQQNQRIVLDLGRVGDIADIRINDQKVTTLWAPPFRADITQYLQVGENQIEIRVTNTWHNRLSYDASLPKAKRKTWTFAGPKPNMPMEPAGLLGPVVLDIGTIVKIPQP